MAIFLGNAFSLGMLQASQVSLKVSEVDTATVKDLLQAQDFQSAVGHQGTSEILNSLLGIEVPMNRISIKLNKGDVLVVIQLLCRLEEGKVLTADEIRALPFKFYIVEVL